MNPEDKNLIDNPQEDLLVHHLQRVLLSVPGAPERQKIADLLLEARWFQLSNKLVQNLSLVVDQKPHQIEQNLDFLGFPGPIWVEYPNNAKVTSLYTDGQQGDIREKTPIRSGFLLSGNGASSSDPETLSCFVVWQFEGGSTYFSPAIIYWDTLQTKELADMSRFKLSKVREECIERILETVHVSLTQGLEEEIIILADDGNEERVIRESMQNSASESLFILSSLLALSTPDMDIGSSFLKNGEEIRCVSVAQQPQKRHPIWLWLKGHSGFYRQETKEGTKLRWRDTNQH